VQGELDAHSLDQSAPSVASEPEPSADNSAPPIIVSQPAPEKLAQKPGAAQRGYWIVVRVSDAALRPLVSNDVRVVVEDEQGGHFDVEPIAGRSEWGCKSDGLHDGKFKVTVSAGGYRPRTLEAMLSQDKHAAILHAVLRSASLIKIRILSDEGGELAARLAREPHHGEPVSPPPRDGPTIVRGLGGWGFHSPVVIAVATQEKPSARLPETNLAAHSRYGAGIYRGWGSRYHHPANGSDLVETDDDIPDAHAGILELFEPLPLYVSACVRNFVLESKLVEPGTEEVSFTVTLNQLKSCFGEVRLRVVDAVTEQPIEGCEVNFLGPDNGGDGYRLGAQAAAVFECIPAGPMPLAVLAIGHAAISTQIRVEAGQVNDLGTFRMEPAVSIRGTITDPTGKPLARPGIGLVPLDEYKTDQRLGSLWNNNYDFDLIDSGSSLFAIGANEAGEFAALNLKRGRYLLRMIYGWSGKRDWIIHPLIVDTTGGSVEGLRVEAQIATPVRVRLDRDAPEDAWMRIFDSDQNPVRDEDFSRNLPTGPFPILPGSYSCVVYFNGVEHAKLNLDVGSSPVTLEIPR